MSRMLSNGSSAPPTSIQDNSSENEEKSKTVEAETKPKEPSKLKKLWNKAGLDWPTVRTMAKAGISPVIALSIYQSTAVAELYTTIGYLVAIATILSVPIMPRAKFMQTMVLNVISVCVGAAMSLLALWTSIKAREYTTPAGGSQDAYNSSAAVVCAIWLFFEVYVINSMRSFRPQYVFPGILTSIFAVVSLSYGPSFPTMTYAINFARTLLMGFLTGFAIATGVSLLIFPLSSRQVVFKELTGYLGAIRGLVKAQRQYMESLENIDMFKETVPEAKAVKEAVAGLKMVQGKLAQDIEFAKREVAWGYLQPSDLSEISRQLRQILLALVGMTFMIDILQRISKMNGWDKLATPDTNDGNPVLDERKQKAIYEWQNVMQTLHKPFQEITHEIDDAIEHILLTLEFKERPKESKTKSNSEPQTNDVEANGDVVRPGDRGFSAHYENKTKQFHENREGFLRKWCETRGISAPTNMSEINQDLSTELQQNSTGAQREQRSILVFLYIEWLLWSISNSVLDLVRFADLKVSDGTMSKKRLIYPGKKRFRKWIMTAFKHQGMSNDEHYDVPAEETSEQDVYFGEALRTRKDPEHLPPTNLWQRVGDVIRRFPRMMRSHHSVFGFRVACAVMSISVIAYLKNTHQFFVVQRLFWAAIMVAISMNRLAGQSLFNFIFRVFGTFVAGCAAIVIYYMADGHAAGVLVFEYIWICSCFYIVVKYPRFIVIGMISSVTSILIIGYELQVDKLGVVVATSNEQAYYPIYLLAPYRLATVAGGLFVAFFWTVFPYAISEHSEIRRDLGMGLYLLANHYTIVHETVSSRIRGDECNTTLKSSHGRKLEKVRHDMYSRGNLVVARMKQNSGFQKWQVRLGGKFPAELYDSSIACVENILGYAALLSYSSRTFMQPENKETTWQKDFTKLLGPLQSTSEEIITRLCLLSNSVANGIPLPPHLQAIEPYGLLQRLQALDKDILSVDHVTEPGYSAFAVMQIGTRSIISDLNKLTDNVREIVGELDFSFHSATTQCKSNSSGAKESVGGKAQKKE